MKLNENKRNKKMGNFIYNIGLNNYQIDKLIEYKNIEISVLKYLQKPNLPYPFHVFYPIMVKGFLADAPLILQKFQHRPTQFLHLTLFNNQYAVLNYKNLVDMVQMTLEELRD
jgi:hypothetical protein